MLRGFHGHVPIMIGDTPKLIEFPNFEAFCTIFYSKQQERDWRMLQQRAAGKTLEAVGREHSLTRERVRQIEQKFLRKLLAHYQKSLS
jgi:hypothetical protein